MKRLIPLVLFVATLACAGDQDSPTRLWNRVNEDGLSGVALCPEKAIMACVIMAEQYGFDNTRIVYGRTDTGAHVQAQVRIDGVWRWVHTGGFSVEVVDNPDNFSPGSTFSVDQVWGRVRNQVW